VVRFNHRPLYRRGRVHDGGGGGDGTRVGLGVVVQPDIFTVTVSVILARPLVNVSTNQTRKCYGFDEVPVDNQQPLSIVFLKDSLRKCCVRKRGAMRTIPTPTIGPTLPRCQDSSHSVNCIPLACNSNKGEHITRDSLDRHALLQANEHM
jgi:hypothetical protein